MWRFLDFVKHTECKGFPRRSSHWQARESENFARRHQDSSKWQKPDSKYLKEKCIGSWTGEVLDQVGSYFWRLQKGHKKTLPLSVSWLCFPPWVTETQIRVLNAQWDQTIPKHGELGAEKGLLQDPARSWVAHALKLSNLLPCVQVSIPGPGRSHMLQSN